MMSKRGHRHMKKQLQLRGRRRTRGYGRADWRLLAAAAVFVSALLVCGCGVASISVGRVGTGPTDTERPFEVLLIPEVNAGWAGWCFVAVGVRGGACGNGGNH